MKTFNQFITEAYDKEMAGQASRAPGEGGRIRASRKKDRADMPSPLSKGKAKPRMQAVGGGKTAPAKSYKPRKDIGTNKPKSRTQQQPTQQRGTAGVKGKEAQKKAYLERKKRSAVKDEASGKDKKIDLKKSADKLLSKKKKTADPKYKSQKASGYTAPERQKIIRSGRRLARDIAQGKEKPISHYDPGIRKG